MKASSLQSLWDFGTGRVERLYRAGISKAQKGSFTLFLLCSIVCTPWPRNYKPASPIETQKSSLHQRTSKATISGNLSTPFPSLEKPWEATRRLPRATVWES